MEFPKSLTKVLSVSGVAAVLMIEDARDAIPLSRALLAGGVRAMELTLRTPAALEALTLVRADASEMLAGVGTILRPEQVRQVADAGGMFGVAPGLNPRVVRAAAEVGLPFAPGVATPSDVEAALELGCRTLKFFPAEASGGLTYLDSMAAPFAHLGVRYIPLGGIAMGNLGAYLGNSHVLAVGGSWLAPQDLIRRKDWDAIEKLAREARQLIDAIPQQSS